MAVSVWRRAPAQSLLSPLTTTTASEPNRVRSASSTPASCSCPRSVILRPIASSGSRSGASITPAARLLVSSGLVLRIVAAMSHAAAWRQPRKVVASVGACRIRRPPPVLQA